jgi:predicted nuclease of predicted toxin-antitoxin system
MRILIDECLTVRLVDVAQQAGFEAYHVAHRGWNALKDPALFAQIQDESFTFVTNNRDDFITLVQQVDLHAGLIVILPNVRRDEQIALFSQALALASSLPSMVNRVIEIGRDGSAQVYELPA